MNVPEHEAVLYCKSAEYMNLHFKVKGLYNKYIADQFTEDMPEYPLWVPRGTNPIHRQLFKYRMSVHSGNTKVCLHSVKISRIFFNLAFPS